MAQRTREQWKEMPQELSQLIRSILTEELYLKAYRRETQTPVVAMLKRREPQPPRSTENTGSSETSASPPTRSPIG